MSTALAKTPGTAVATTGDNPFTRLGKALRPKSIFGVLLKFNHGEWIANEKTIPHDTKLVAIMDKMVTGWVRWEDKRPTEHIMFDPMKGEIAPVRRLLGRDDDQTQWAVDKKGNPIDPWQFTMYLPLIANASGGTYFGAAYTFAATSKGARDACGDLSTAFGNHSDWETDYPVVKLSRSSYVHDDYGRVITPELPIASYVKRSSVAAAIAKALNSTPENNQDDDHNFGRESENPGQDMDDEIPF
jgi:hypothetical protein